MSERTDGETLIGRWVPDPIEWEWKPGDSPVLPPVPDSCYPPDAVPLEEA